MASELWLEKAIRPLNNIRWNVALCLMFMPGILAWGIKERRSALRNSTLSVLVRPNWGALREHGRDVDRIITHVIVDSEKFEL